MRSFALLTLLALAARADVLENGRRPLMWQVAQRPMMPAGQVARLSKMFAAAMKSVQNNAVNAGGIILRVNHIVCATTDDATKLVTALVKFKQGQAMFVMRRGTDVIEFVCDNRLVVQKARDWIGWDEPQTVTWEVSMRVAPLAHAPPMRWNRLFNVLWAYRRTANDDTARRVRTESAGFRFDDTARFRTEENPWGKPRYTFDKKLEDAATGRFEKLPRELGIPVLNVRATIPVRPFATRGDGDKRPDARLLAETDFWPVDDPVVKAAARQAVPAGKKLTPRGHVEWLLRWVQTNVRYDGKVQGSRWGVRKCLQQGFGHCWDKSDVFITMCRASGIPARQVGGWVDKLSGHIWADVWIRGEGWVEVDATASWLGTSGDYIPFWISEDGGSPFLYWEMPGFRRKP